MGAILCANLLQMGQGTPLLLLIFKKTYILHMNDAEILGCGGRVNAAPSNGMVLSSASTVQTRGPCCCFI